MTVSEIRSDKHKVTCSNLKADTCHWAWGHRSLPGFCFWEVASPKSASLHCFLVQHVAVPSFLEPQCGKTSLNPCGSEFQRENRILDGGRNIVMRFRKGKEGHRGSQGICVTMKLKLACVEIEGRKKKVWRLLRLISLSWPSVNLLRVRPFCWLNDNHTMAVGCGWAGLFLNYLGDSITAKFTLTHLCHYHDLATRDHSNKGNHITVPEKGKKKKVYTSTSITWFDKYTLVRQNSQLVSKILFKWKESFLSKLTLAKGTLPCWW